ncbi:luciferase family protein [Streptomyces sp. cf386]|uniref:luciferase domain-containing protein n=1 Tax=Streptomyces sp. cf386 TaxID=1761904 RepID=UPI000B83BF9A|nr:luciferase family protein [Streptomyces sp. cf386]
MTTASRAMTQLAGRPDLSEAPPSCGTGRALRSARAESVHFHSDRNVDLHLTARTIRRFQDELKNSTAVRLVPDSHWVTIHLECESDIDQLLTLVSVALQAHQRSPDAVEASSPGCKDHRFTHCHQELRQ